MEKTDKHKNVELLYLVKIKSSSLIPTAMHTYWPNPSPSQGPHKDGGLGCKNQHRKQESTLLPAFPWCLLVTPVEYI